VLVKDSPRILEEILRDINSVYSKHIRDSMEVTKFHRKSMAVEHARNLFKLSEAEDLRDEAEIYLKRRKPNVVACDMENAYNNLIPIFWR
jgi:hypothetical protein